MDEKLNEGPFIIYGQGVEDFQGGTFWQIADGGGTYFWQVADGQHFFNPRKLTFCAFQGKTKNIFDIKFLREGSAFMNRGQEPRAGFYLC